jgi:hypothetical protein
MRVWARQLLEAEETATTADAEVMRRHLSEVSKLTMRESASPPRREMHLSAPALLVGAQGLKPWTR